MRIGIFGGSFDPIHFGHLWVAEAALESLQLTELRWIPAATSPLKRSGPVAADTARLQMIQLAVSGCPEYVVDDREIRRGAISYTVDSVNELKAEFPDAEIMMVIGSDSLASIGQWREPENLLQNVVPAVVQRGGSPSIDFSVLEDLATADRIALFRKHVIEMPVVELSSSELRSRVTHGRSIRFRVPRAVESLIEAESLYRSS